MNKIPTNAWAVLAGLILLISAIAIFKFGFHDESVATRFSVIILVGLALTVVFMAILAIIFSVMGVADPKQALALPEGSVRALLAFSLVLIFVCLGAFLFNEVNRPCDNCEKTLSRVSDSQLADLRNNFIVAAERATDKDGKLLYEQTTDPKNPANPPVDDLQHPLYNVTCWPKPNPATSDFAKQIFTTIATIFVSVVSFYFGSSVTSSAAAAGVKAVQGSDTDKKATALQADLTNALADSHNAQAALDTARVNATKAAGTITEASAQAAVSDAEQNLKVKQAAVQRAQDALNAYRPGNASTIAT